MRPFRYIIGLCVLYALFAINQASDDYHTWSQTSRNWFLVLGIIGAIIVFFVEDRDLDELEDEEEEDEDGSHDYD